MQPTPPPPPPAGPPLQACYRHPDRPGGIVCQRCDRPICTSCMHQASVGFHCPECTKQGAQKVYQGVASFQQRPIVTEILIGANLLVFLIGALVVTSGGYLSGEGTSFHADFASTAYRYVDGFGNLSGGVGGGEWYRLVTSGFVHFGIIHLAVNMYSLWILGRAAEHYAGRLAFATIYGVSLLAGSLGSMLLDPGALSAGASGAIFGLMGAMFLAYRAQGIPLSRSPLLSVLVLNIIITFSVPGIAIGAHLGGLVGGAVTGWLFFDLARRPGIAKQVPFVLSGAVAPVCVIGSIVAATSYSPL